MAPTLKIDRFNNLSMTEVNGVVTEVEREAILVGLATEANTSDYNVLITAINQAGVPQQGSTISNPDSDVFSRLVLWKRLVKVANDDKGTVVIGLSYKVAGNEGPSQNLVAGDQFGRVYGKITASIKTKTTNFYYNKGDRTGQKIPIVVGHKFASDDAHYARQYREQGGEVHVHEPSKNLRLSGYHETQTPEILANSLIARVNKGTWLGDGEREWMCTEVAWESMGFKDGLGGDRYRFDFEWQHDPDTWDPTATFIDERTGRPPVGIRDYATPIGGDPDYPNRSLRPGQWQVPYQAEIDFDKEFGIFFDGF